MSSELRKNACRSIGQGMLAALTVTLPGMALIALAAAYAALDDGAILMLNQALKLAAIFTGARKAVGRGGTRGFQLGATVGLLYIALGYGICALWDGMMATGWMLTAEFMLGMLLGGLSGAFMANLPARTGGRGHKTVKA